MAETILIARHELSRLPGPKGSGFIRLERWYSDEGAPHILAPWSTVRDHAEAKRYAAQAGAELRTARVPSIHLGADPYTSPFTKEA